MATRKAHSPRRIARGGSKKDDVLGGDLGPDEEKTLDWILNGIIIFVLGWLALGILLSVGGLFGLWK